MAEKIQVPEITTVTVDSNAILDTMDILRRLCMKGNLSKEADTEVWQAYSKLQHALIESPEFKEFSK